MTYGWNIARWAVVTVASAALAALVGTAAVQALSGALWSGADLTWLAATAVLIALGASILLFVPLTLIGSLLFGRFRVLMPSLVVASVGTATYLQRFGLRPPRDDRALAWAVIWLSLVLGQAFHAVLLSRGAQPRPAN